MINLISDIQRAAINYLNCIREGHEARIHKIGAATYRAIFTDPRGRVENKDLGCFPTCMEASVALDNAITKASHGALDHARNDLAKQGRKNPVRTHKRIVEIWSRATPPVDRSPFEAGISQWAPDIGGHLQCVDIDTLGANSVEELAELIETDWKWAYPVPIRFMPFQQKLAHNREQLIELINRHINRDYNDNENWLEITEADSVRLAKTNRLEMDFDKGGFVIMPLDEFSVEKVQELVRHAVGD